MAATADRQAGHRNESLFVGVENDFRSRLLNDRSSPKEPAARPYRSHTWPTVRSFLQSPHASILGFVLNELGERREVAGRPTSQSIRRLYSGSLRAHNLHGETPSVEFQISRSPLRNRQRLDRRMLCWQEDAMVQTFDELLCRITQRNEVENIGVFVQ